MTSSKHFLQLSKHLIIHPLKGLLIRKCTQLKKMGYLSCIQWNTKVKQRMTNLFSKLNFLIPLSEGFSTPQLRTYVIHWFHVFIQSWSKQSCNLKLSFIFKYVGINTIEANHAFFFKQLPRPVDLPCWLGFSLPLFLLIAGFTVRHFCPLFWRFCTSYKLPYFLSATNNVAKIFMIEIIL